MESSTGIESLHCPDCGAPVIWKEGLDEQICPYCGTALTFKNLKIINVKDNEKTFDLNNADPGELSKLEGYISSIKYKKINLNAMRLLRAELGQAQYDKLIQDFISIKGSDGNEYRITNKGYIQVFDPQGKELKDGQMIPNEGYPIGDMFVSLFKYIKFNAIGLNRAWGCGKLSFKGGEISVD